MSRIVIPFPRGSYLMPNNPAPSSYRVEIGEKPSVRFSTEKQWGHYSKACRYPALAVDCVCFVTERALQLVANLDVAALAVPCGYSERLGLNRLVLDAEPVEPGIFRVVYVEQGRGLALFSAQGWLIAGHLYRAERLRTAQRQYARQFVTPRLRVAAARAGAL